MEGDVLIMLSKEQKIIYGEMVELTHLVCKYSFEQLKTIISNLDINKLQNDMRSHGATKEELRVSAETFNDVMDYIF